MINIFAVVLVVIGLVEVMRMTGKASLSVTVLGSEGVELDVGEVTPERKAELKENETLYNGKAYALNEDLVTVLVMGIDKETVTEVGGQSWEADEAGGYAGGQADALFLLLINPTTKTFM